MTEGAKIVEGWYENVPMICVSRHYGRPPYKHSDCAMAPDYSELTRRIDAAFAEQAAKHAEVVEARHSILRPSARPADRSRDGGGMSRLLLCCRRTNTHARTCPRGRWRRRIKAITLDRQEREMVEAALVRMPGWLRGKGA